MISQTVEYALRAATILAANGDTALTAQNISERTKSPAPYLSKVLQPLIKAGIVISQRGLNGGYVLAKPPNEITVYDVVNAVEPFHHYTECPLGFMTHSPHLCPLHRRLEAAARMIEASLKETTLEQLLIENPTNPPLCGCDVSGAI